MHARIAERRKLNVETRVFLSTSIDARKMYAFRFDDCWDWTETVSCEFEWKYRSGIYSILYTVSQQSLRTLAEFCVFDLLEKPKVQIYLRLHINKIIINYKRDEED